MVPFLVELARLIAPGQKAIIISIQKAAMPCIGWVFVREASI
jgi:hypothetical protein